MVSQDTALLMAVTAFAAHAHRNQRRKGSGKLPYINHCIQVAQIIAKSQDDHASSDVICAALLHDVVEDTPVSSTALRATFGDAIADLVAEVTDDKSLPKAERKALQVSHASALSPGACLIKLADKTTNVRDLALDPPPDWSLKRVLEYVRWAERVVHQLPHQPPVLMADFEAACQEARARFPTHE